MLTAKYALILDVRLIKSDQSQIDKAYQSPTELDLLMKNTKPVLSACGVAMGDQGSCGIMEIHQHSDHPGVKHNTWSDKLIPRYLAQLSRPWLRGVLNASSIDLAPMHWQNGKLGVCIMRFRLGMDITKLWLQSLTNIFVIHSWLNSWNHQHYRN